MKPLPQNYDHKETESRWQQHWLEQGTYHWDESAARADTFVIDTPPPTVSGHLHMGHIFSYTQADFVARFQRMNGKTVFYPMGFDDNGLPTERLVEKEKKIQAAKYIQEHGREGFIDVCMGVSEQARKDFRSLFQSTALSVDWRQEYHTISEDSRRLSQASFLDLMSKNAVERRLEPMLWDPIDQTAIAQAEVVDQELASTFNDIYFGIEGSAEKITIATTRPELIPACVGVFYHPEDTRYTHLKGKFAVTPLFGVKVPILEDDSVEMEKGTGIMMCCTFGDEKDIEKWRKHKLELKLVLNKYGKMELTEGHPLQGLKAAAARTKILELLKDSGDLIESKPITHAVKCAERSGAPLEILPSPQWFVKVTNIKDELKAKSAECNWHPEWMKVRMDQWIDGLNWDWCISRQRYFGVPFPVWHVSEKVGERPGEIVHRSGDGTIKNIQPTVYEDFRPCNTIVAELHELPVNPLKDPPNNVDIISQEGLGVWRAKCRETGKDLLIHGDTDVMDTWATSSISPQLNAQSINGGDRYAKLFPADLRPQAHEIIRTWAFYTIVKSHYHANDIPWKNLMISGWCLAEDKSKMSKSKGNVVTPNDLIAENGADVVRYWASTSRLGQDTAFSRDLLKIGKKLVNKLWNATKFAAIHLDKLPATGADKTKVTATLDKWVLHSLASKLTTAHIQFGKYEYATARAAIEDFFWNDFCDNYLELVKKRVYDEAGNDPEGQMSAVHTIALCLDIILRAFAPFLPHITEELWSHIFPTKYAQSGSIHARGTWPLAEELLTDTAAHEAGIATLELLEAIRKAKSEKGVSIKWPIEQMTVSALNAQHATLPDDLQLDLLSAGNVHAIHWAEKAASDAITSEGGNFALSFAFAAQSDAA